MKLIVVLGLLAFASCDAASLKKSELAQDLDDFKNLIPVDDITATAITYFIFDSEFRGFVNYLQGSDARGAWSQSLGHAEIQRIVEYLESEGVNVIDMLNKLADLLGFPHYPSYVIAQGSRSVKGFFEDVVDMLPLNKIQNLLNEKRENSEAFSRLLAELSVFDYKDFAEFAQNSREMTNLLNKIRGYGLDIDKFIEMIKKFFGWE